MPTLEPAASEPGAPPGSPVSDALGPAAAPSPRSGWRWLVPGVVLAGLIVFLPALRSPPYLDDYSQAAMIEGTYPAPRSPFDLYNFVTDADRALLLDRGVLPWWSHPHLTLRFLSPLSSALLYADHRVFGQHALASHIHSLAWWAAAVFAAYALYRRLLPARAATLAAFVFALAPCHALSLVSFANREALVSTAFGTLGLAALALFRERGSARYAAGAALLFTVSLLGGRVGLGFGGYALALALTGRGVPALRRGAALLAFVAPAAAYLVVSARLGFGVQGSGLYGDPLRHPAAFVLGLPRHLVDALAPTWLTFPAPDAGWAAVPMVLAGAALLVLAVRRAFAGLDGPARERATWLLLGSALSLAPVLAAAPAPRPLTVSMLGVAATLALVLERAWFPRVAEPRTRARDFHGLLALALGWAHLVHAPGVSWGTSGGYQLQAHAFAAYAAGLRARVADPAAADVVVVQGISGGVFVLPYALDARGTPPASFRTLSVTERALVLRQGPKVLDLVVARDRGLLPLGEGNVFRAEGTPLRAGDAVRVRGMRATVLEVGDAGPRRVRFEFDDALDAPSRVWLTDRLDGLHEATLPELGLGKVFEAWPQAGAPHVD